ncbi:MAG: hypothetical protein H0W86_11460 [Armatimonadetes bacterium]|nr:hypothetical protein [Armatimonadota bacterium]
MLRTFIVAVLLSVCIACNKHTLDRDIIGIWENTAAPTSPAVELSVRQSNRWQSRINFEPEGSLTWTIVDGSQSAETWSGNYEVDGPSVTLVLSKKNEVPLEEQKEYTIRVREQTLSLPIPNDWTGPTVEYAKRPSA